MNNLYTRLHAGFSEWLRILNFEPTSQRDMPKMLMELKQQCYHPHDIKDIFITGYITHLSERPNYKWEGGLSKNYIRKQLQVVNKFSRYLTESGQESFSVKLRIKGKSSNVKSILTVKEVELLYQATTDDMLGLRDRAILALYYGCGLRKNEGVNININDILLDKELVYVRKGKGYKERYVPLSTINKADLENYIYYARPHLLNQDNRKEEALLLTIKGKRLSGMVVYKRVRYLWCSLFLCAITNLASYVAL